ncbi:MAG: hypothetical protein P8K08_21700 [Fuerstiella sp.]|jgi:hypothetical protein|nr:hypothetical protein [Fuerstiella sp.]
MKHVARPCTGEILRRVNQHVAAYDGPQYQALNSLDISPNHLANWNKGLRSPSGPMIDRLMDRLGLVIVEATP